MFLITVSSKGKSMKASFSAVRVLSVGTILAALGGCAAEVTRPGVPSNAVEVSSGNKVISFSAPHDGTAYLNDDSNHGVVYSIALKRDQVMRFDPATDTVRIDGNTAPEVIPDPGHDHSIYFARSAKPDLADAASNTNTNTTPVTNGGSQAIPTVRVPIGVDVVVQPQQPAQPAPK
jgi:hypothetical protein